MRWVAHLSQLGRDAEVVGKGWIGSLCQWLWAYDPGPSTGQISSAMRSGES